MLVDFHMHSVFSDGVETPKELLRHALDCNVSMMALTDHDEIDGIQALRAAQKELDPNKAYGRPHIGKLLIDGGYAKDINDVFKGILRKDSPCYVPKVKVEVPYIIDIIHKAGGLAVMAHPKLVTSDEYVLEMLNYDFDGMEVYHSKHNDDDVERYKEFAKKHKLFITGGSDYHGIVGKKPDRFGDYLVSGKDVSEFISLL